MLFSILHLLHLKEVVLWVDLHHLYYKQETYEIVKVKKGILFKHQGTDML